MDSYIATIQNMQVFSWHFGYYQIIQIKQCSFYISYFKIFSISPDALDSVMSNCDSYSNSCSENFLVRWDSMGMPKEIEKLNNLPALFTVTESQPTDCTPSASDLNSPNAA